MNRLKTILACGLLLGAMVTSSCASDVAGPEDVAAETVADLTEAPETTEPDAVPDVPLEEVPELVETVDTYPDILSDVPDVASPDLEGSDDLADANTQEVDPVDLVEEVEVAPEDIYVPPCESGLPCDDLDPCTVDDICTEGLCAGMPYLCDDLRPCTLDSCDGLGNCQYTLMVGKCLINGICAKSGQKKPDDQCRFCDPMKNPFKWSQTQFSPCDDGDSCTVNDQCIDAVCEGEETICNDDNPCTLDICDEDVGCTFPAANVPCDDADPCTALDFCFEGECKGGYAPPCDDQNPCTADTCQPGKGCFHTLLDGKVCDDGDACTIGDVCEGADCIPGGQKPICDDWNDCTDDICDTGVGCIFPLNGNPCCINDINVCDDNDACTIDTCNVDTGQCIYLPNEGSCTDKNACTENDTCIEGECVGSAVDCDDGNPCTLDFCQSMVGCSHESLNMDCDDGSVCTLSDQCINGICTGTPVNCNDYNVCTSDSCDPVEGCKSDFNSAPCNDLDLCTADDSCSGGVCSGQPKTCDDGNACTDDFCDPSSGCQNPFNSSACDDGDPCTDGDACQGGVCIAGEVICLSCDYEFSDAVNRLNSMQISEKNTAGEALDLNGDGNPDNGMAGIGGMANEPLMGSVEGGDIHFLFEHHGLKTDGNVYLLTVAMGDLAPGFEQCNFSKDYCGYVAAEETIDADTCEPAVSFDNASIFQGKLVAGGPSFLFPWQVPLSEETILDITLYNATIHADVTVQQGLVTSMEGIIGGAIPKQQFLDAIDAVPAEQLPLPKDMIVQLISVLVVNDIDTDGNGSPDAASIAIKFTAIPGGIVGLE